MLRFASCLAFTSIVALALSTDETALLQSAGGWEYQTINDPNNGFQTQGTCFTKAYTGECQGDLIFRTDGTFQQNITAHGRSQHRGGRYEINGDQVTFWDEHNTQDGPYLVALDLKQKTLHITASRGTVGIDMTLLLKSEFKKRMAPKK